MLIRKAYKFKLNPNQHQIARLAVLCGHSRFIWNHGLRFCLNKLSAGEKIPSAFDLNKLVTQWKKTDELAWLSEAYTDNLQQKMKDLRTAFTRFYDKSLEAKKPVFKKKGKSTDSIRFVNFEKYCTLEGRRVKMPSGLGWMKFRRSQKIKGTVKNCSISKNSEHYYISFQVEINTKKEIHVHPSTKSVGLDMGIAKFVTLSSGEQIKPLSAFRKHEEKLALAQQKLSKKVKFSQNWKKQNKKVQHLHTRIANCRRDYLHKTSTNISQNHAMIAVEDLRIKNMSSSAKGNIEAPGNNVAAKSGLNKSILDQGWYEFRRQLEYKQKWRGGIAIAVPAHYTSQTCPCCQHRSRENRKTQAHFECVECQYTENADIVGAINVLERGHRLIACGEMTPSV